MALSNCFPKWAVYSKRGSVIFSRCTEKCVVILTEWKELLVYFYEMNTIQIFKLIYDLSFGKPLHKEGFFFFFFTCFSFPLLRNKRQMSEQCSSVVKRC